MKILDDKIIAGHCVCICRRVDIAFDMGSDNALGMKSRLPCNIRTCKRPYERRQLIVPSIVPIPGKTIVNGIFHRILSKLLESPAGRKSRSECLTPAIQRAAADRSHRLRVPPVIRSRWRIVRCLGQTRSRSRSIVDPPHVRRYASGRHVWSQGAGPGRTIPMIE